MSTTWTPSSWQNFPALQQPTWPDPDAYEAVLQDLGRQVPLVFAGEARRLTSELARACRGDAFVLQGGDCAETFAAHSADTIREKIRILLQMAVVLTYGGSASIVKIGRIAGQYAKPRSSDNETIDGVTLPSYRGDAANGLDFTAESRVPNPQRLRQVYDTSAATLNLIRAFVQGGFADLHRVAEWNKDFVANSPQGQRFDRIAKEIQGALDFMQSIGIAKDDHQTRATHFFTSHEALILGYEQALTRCDSTSGQWVDTSAHMLWIGERTRQLDGAHVEFMRGILNPIGCKVGPSMGGDELIALIDKLNPDNVEGKLTLITRMGAGKIREALPPLLERVKQEGRNVVWITDPCHGNTITSSTGYKTRRFDDVMDEIVGFFEAHDTVGTIPGGLHMELTGENVTEVVGGGQQIDDHDLALRYESAVDPRLNNAQSLEMAFRVAEILQKRKHAAKQA